MTTVISSFAYNSNRVGEVINHAILACSIVNVKAATKTIARYIASPTYTGTMADPHWPHPCRVAKSGVFRKLSWSTGAMAKAEV